MGKVNITREELAKRWNCTEWTIDDRRRKGILHQLENLPGVQYAMEEVLALEKRPEDPLSPAERRRLEREIKVLQNKNQALEEALRKISAPVLEYLKEDRA